MLLALVVAGERYSPLRVSSVQFTARAKVKSGMPLRFSSVDDAVRSRYYFQRAS